MLYSKLRLITFDSTGTLLQFGAHPLKKYAEIASMYGINCDLNLLKANFKNQWKKMSVDHPNFGRYTGLGWENWWRNIVVHTFEGHKVDEQKLNMIANHLIKEYEGRNSWLVTRGALDLLSYLRHSGITVGVISNFDPRLHKMLENIKLKHYFRFVITSYDVGVEKPQREIFVRAMKAADLKILKPEECLHIGDSAALDYVGAVKAGWNALLLLGPNDNEKSNNENDCTAVDKNHVFNSMYDLQKYIMNNREMVKR